jgi:uncharacterized membrane protein YkoI
MDKKSMVIVAVVVGVIAIVGGMVWSAEKDKMKGKGEGEDNTQVVAMARTAKITIEQAIKTAADNFPGKVIEAELEKKDDRTVWEIEILTAEQGIMVVRVDADSGSVITTEEKKVGKKVESEQKR